MNLAIHFLPIKPTISIVFYIFTPNFRLNSWISLKSHHWYVWGCYKILLNDHFLILFSLVATNPLTLPTYTTWNHLGWRRWEFTRRSNITARINSTVSRCAACHFHPLLLIFRCLQKSRRWRHISRRGTRTWRVILKGVCREWRWSHRAKGFCRYEHLWCDPTAKRLAVCCGWVGTRTYRQWRWTATVTKICKIVIFVTLKICKFYLSVKNFLYGCWCEEDELEQLLPSSIMSNFRFTDPTTTEPSGLGRIAIGDILRRVAKDLRVGDGDMPYWSRITLWRLKKIMKIGLF